MRCGRFLAWPQGKGASFARFVSIGDQSAPKDQPESGTIYGYVARDHVLFSVMRLRGMSVARFALVEGNPHHVDDRPGTEPVAQAGTFITPIYHHHSSHERNGLRVNAGKASVVQHGFQGHEAFSRHSPFLISSWSDVSVAGHSRSPSIETNQVFMDIVTPSPHLGRRKTPRRHGTAPVSFGTVDLSTLMTQNAAKENTDSLNMPPPPPSTGRGKRNLEGVENESAQKAKRIRIHINTNKR